MKKNSVAALPFIFCHTIYTSQQSLPVNKKGYTEFHTAAARGSITVIQKLFAEHPKQFDEPSGYNTFDKKSHKDTPLGLAMYQNRAQVVEFLVSQGADINKINASGKQAGQNYRYQKEKKDMFAAIQRGLNKRQPLFKTTATQTELLSTTRACQTEATNQNSNWRTFTNYDVKKNQTFAQDQKYQKLLEENLRLQEALRKIKQNSSDIFDIAQSITTDQATAATAQSDTADQPAEDKGSFTVTSSDGAPLTQRPSSYSAHTRPAPSYNSFLSSLQDFRDERNK